MKPSVKFFLKFLSLMVISLLAQADCVYLSLVTGYTVSNNHNVLLYRGDTPVALVKTLDFIFKGSRLQLLKDSICSYDSNVFLLDGDEVIGVEDVKSL